MSKQIKTIITARNLTEEFDMMVNKLLPVAAAIIYIIGVLAALWFLWLALDIISGLYMRLRDKWVQIRQGEKRYHLYLKHMNDFDKYIEEREENHHV